MSNIKTIKQFAEKSNISESLIRAVIRQSGGWEYFKERALDIARYGAGGGHSGFIWYSETVAFFDRNKKEILELAIDQAEDFGMDILTMIAGFNCLKGYTTNDIAAAIYGRSNPESQTVKNALAWFALEEVARSFADLSENY